MVYFQQWKSCHVKFRLKGKEKYDWQYSLHLANCMSATWCHKTLLVKVNAGEAKAEEKTKPIFQITKEYPQHRAWMHICGMSHECDKILNEVPAEVSSLPVWTSYCYICLPHIFKTLWGLSIIMRCHSKFFLRLSIGNDQGSISWFYRMTNCSSGSLLLILWIWIAKYLYVHFCIQLPGGSITVYLYSWSVALLLK